ncbi:Adhesion G protein-coupled receptor B3 [Acropora cervicornis]|uniref:Adhesion G protein-coupled receptor B3 n=1 Tax=Acropora cervicornis TaxID=6130 RepID=A0AAD9QZI4_ACRCE|nr:Adhesion G protein-coupled receptor B3 [Acropora cervicornis]
MAFHWLLWINFLVTVPLSCLACPEKCLCSEKGSIGSSSYKKIVNCTGKLGDLDGFPHNIPLDSTNLILKGNRINQFSVEAFLALTKLVILDLSDNRLTTVPLEIFKYAPDLKEVNLRGNPLTCDCNFAGAQSAAGHLSVFEGSCDKPNELRGKNINSLKLWELCPCFDGLGMEDRSIADVQITASSFKSDGGKTYKPQYGRLNNKPSGAMGGAWCADVSDTSRYLQIDLKKEMTLSGISTQGQSDEANWVVKYKIQHSLDGAQWRAFKEFGQEKVFDGNLDQDSVVAHWFNARFRARFVKIVPTLFSSSTNTVCMRVEVHGCDTDVQSVKIRSSSTKNCWSPQASSNPCAPGEGTLLSLQSYCQGEGVMLTLRQDDTIVHSCSGKCVYLNPQGFLALENEPCDKFTKRNHRSGTFALSHVASGSCLNVDVSKRLKLGSCKTPHMFEVTTSGLQPIAPKFKMTNPQYLTLDEPGWIYCRVASDPSVKFFWSKLNPWPFGDRLNDLEFVPLLNGSLFVRRAKKTYEGDIYCTAVNSGGHKSSAINTSVNSSALFDCKVKGSEIKVTWFKRLPGSTTLVSALKLGKRFNIFPNGSLKISLVKKSDEAFYRCHAENPVGYTNASAFLRVLVPPSFTIVPSGASEPSGSSPVYNCQATGDPVPVISWTKVGSSQPTTETLRNGSLWIKTIQKADEGRYRCLASNKVKTVTREITISVYTACRVDSHTSAIRQPNRLFFAVGEKVVVLCKRGFKKSQDDVDECAVLASLSDKDNSTQLRNCHEKARCINTVGSYSCECGDSYAGDGFNCVAVCSTPSLEANGKWTPHKPRYQIGETVWLQCLRKRYKLANQTISSVTCGKDTQWSTPRPICQDVNECQDRSSCHKDAECINNPGSFTCECKEGFEGDGVKNCKEEKERVVIGTGGKAWKFSTQMDNLVENMHQFEHNNITSNQLMSVILNSSFPGSHTLFPGDLVLSVKAVGMALKKMSLEEKLSSAKKPLEIVSNLLDKRNKEAWNELQKDSKGVTDVMSLVETFAADLTDRLLNERSPEKAVDIVSFETENVAEMTFMLRLTKNISKDMLFPEKAKSNREGSAQIQVAKKLFDKHKGLEVVIISMVFFKDLADLLPKRAPRGREAVAKCVFWDFNKSKELGGSWSSEGCRLVSSSSNNSKICECDHLTHFALLSVYDKRKAERSVIHINLCLAVLAGIALFVGGLKLTQIRAVCILIAALLQYFFTAMFCWAVCEALQLLMTLITRKIKNFSRLKVFYIVGWVVPVIAVAISLGVTQLQGYGDMEWLTMSFLFFLIIAIAGTWVLAAIYVKHHEDTNLWQYAFAGACLLQISNFTLQHKIKKTQHKEKPVDGKAYTVIRPSIKESNADLRGSSKRLSRIGSTTTGIFENEPEYYPTPIMETPVPIDSALKRHIEGQPIPDTPGSEVIQLQTFPAMRKGSSSHFSSAPSESPSDRRPDGAEEPDITTNSLYGERRSSRMSMTRSSDILSSHSKLQQIPEREPLIRRSVRYSEPQLSSPRNSMATRQKPQQKKSRPSDEDSSVSSRDMQADSSRRKSRRSRRRLEEEFGKTDRESILQRKRSLRYSSGFFSGVTVDEVNEKVEKLHASL